MKPPSLSILLVFAVGASSGLAQDPEVIVEVERQEVYEGESILYHVTLNHVDSPSPPELKAFDDFQVTPLGEQSLNSTSITIINGRRREIVRRGRQYNFRLTPRRTGTLAIPAPVARIGNQVLKGRTVTLRVIAPQNQDTVILEVTVDQKSVYPIEPFTVTLNVAVKDLPAGFAERNPFSVQPTPPLLQVPWLDDDQISKGLTPKKGWQSVLQPLLSPRGDGFQINNIGRSSVFSLFEREATAFQPKPRRTQRKDKGGNSVGYWEFAIARTIIPRKVGAYEFGPVTLKGTFATAVEQKRLVGKKLFAIAQSVIVTVKSVPNIGRPDTYLGAVGQFTFTSQLAPTKARVGDPMTLTLTLAGQGTLEEAFPPDLAKLPDIGANFKTYDATTETAGNTRRFIYSLRPLNANIDTFPAIPVSYFDVERERYVSIRSAPISIEINEAERLSEDSIVSGAQRSSLTDRALEAREGGIFANDTDRHSLQDESVKPFGWVLAWTGMIVCYVLVTIVIGHVQRLKADPALVRRRAAAANAQKSLKASLAALRNAHNSDAFRDLRNVFAHLVADVTNTSADGVTPRDAETRLIGLDVGDDLASATRDLVERCDAHRYGVASDDSDELGSQAKDLLERLLQLLKQKRVFR